MGKKKEFLLISYDRDKSLVFLARVFFFLWLSKTYAVVSFDFQENENEHYKSENEKLRLSYIIYIEAHKHTIKVKIPPLLRQASIQNFRA